MPKSMIKTRRLYESHSTPQTEAEKRYQALLEKVGTNEAVIALLIFRLGLPKPKKERF